MILFDTPRPTDFRRFTRTAHLGSTLPGAAGTTELLAFARRIRLEHSWLQFRGTPKEHFDVFDDRIEAARQAGAEEVSPKDFVRRVVSPKKDRIAA